MAITYGISIGKEQVDGGIVPPKSKKKVIIDLKNVFKETYQMTDWFACFRYKNSKSMDESGIELISDHLCKIIENENEFIIFIGDEDISFKPGDLIMFSDDSEHILDKIVI